MSTDAHAVEHISFGCSPALGERNVVTPNRRPSMFSLSAHCRAMYPRERFGPVMLCRILGITVITRRRIGRSASPPQRPPALIPTVSAYHDCSVLNATDAGLRIRDAKCQIRRPPTKACMAASYVKGDELGREGGVIRRSRSFSVSKCNM